ncbi:MAG TPA: YfhO family protein, partial [Lachnospiraceae bacterium]|nr:YfhO family protein [Lachnospiraceae bacterium]
MEQKGRIVFQYSLPAILTFLVVSIVLGIKQIFPFGSNTIDYYDMGQQIAAFYYHVYDALHGEKSLFFDWYSALGTNMTMNTSGCSSISLFNLLLFLFPRDMILQALSVFTMIKMACM